MYPPWYAARCTTLTRATTVLVSNPPRGHPNSRLPGDGFDTGGSTIPTPPSVSDPRGGARSVSILLDSPHPPRSPSCPVAIGTHACLSVGTGLVCQFARLHFDGKRVRKTIFHLTLEADCLATPPLAHLPSHVPLSQQTAARLLWH